MQEVVLQLIREAMKKHAATSKGFLIDGYPRELEQGIKFEKEVNIHDYKQSFINSISVPKMPSTHSWCRHFGFFKVSSAKLDKYFEKYLKKHCSASYY
jgi:adenylate kinase family enzyme